MPRELYDKMFVEAGMPLDEAVLAHGLTMSRSGRVRAKKQHLRMATYLQTQMDCENAENINDLCRKENFDSSESKTISQETEKGEKSVSFRNEIRTTDRSGEERQCTRGGKRLEANFSRNSSGRPKSTFDRSNSFEEHSQATKYDRTQQNFKAMTLSRVPRTRTKEDRPPLAPPAKKDKGSKVPEHFLSKDKVKANSSKFYLDVNGNDASQRGNTLGRPRGKDSSLGSEDELFIPRSSTFSTNASKPTRPSRFTRKSETDDVGKNNGTTLEDMLKNKVAMQAFRDFLKSEFSEENLDFWLDCQQYQSLKGSKQMKMAFTIFSCYLARSAPREVNIDSEIRSRVEENLKNPDKNTFAEAQNCIYSLMKCDSFRRFLASDRYAKLQLTDQKPSFRVTSLKKTR